MPKTDFRNERSSWPVWISTILAIIVIAVLIIQITNPITANDLWWHMALGRHILETGSLIIDHSIFTWTPAAPYYPYNSWLSDILLYFTYDYTGTTGLFVLRYGIYFLLFGLAWRYAISLSVARNPVAWVIIAVALTMVWPAYLIKPELFTIGFFTVVVWLYFHMRQKGESAWWQAYIFPLILIIWVNMHGAFFISSLFFAATIIGEIMNSLFSASQAMPARLRKHYFIAMALCIPAILLSPFGYELPLTIIREVLANENINKYVISYKPTLEFNGPPLYMLDYMIMAMLLFVLLLWQKLKNKQTDWVLILAFLGYCAIFTQVARATFYLGPVFLFTCMQMLSEKKDSWVWSPSKINRSLITVLCILLTILIGWRTVSDNSCKLFGYKDSIKLAFGISDSFPIAETEYIKKNMTGLKIGNIYRDGGYLIYQLWPKKKVMIDPRYFPFRDWVDDYITFSQGRDVEQFIKRNRADYWLIRYNNIVAFQWFYQSKGWKPALLGPTGAVFIPSDDRGIPSTISPEISTKVGFEYIVPAFIAATQTNNLKFAEHLAEIAKNNIGCFCEKNKIIVNEMIETIPGLRAYNSGEYEKAARILGRTTKYIPTQNKAARGLMLLAEQYWSKGDITDARNLYLRAFKISSLKTITDIYNFTLLDWRHNHSADVTHEDRDDYLNWQNFVDLILTQKNKLPQSQQFIVKMAMAMKERRYDGTAPLVLSDGSFSPAPGKQIKD